MKLYHYWRSSGSWRVRWALGLKGLRFESFPVNLLAGENESPAHLARNPMGYVPVLEVDGRALAESVAIIEWLEETHPSPALYPKNALDRAYARQLVEIINAGTQPLMNLTVTEYFSEDTEARKRWSQHWIHQGLQAYETLLAHRGSSGRFSMGDQVTAPDLFLIPQCYGAIRNDVDLARYPRISAINAAALSTPECQAAHPDRFAPAK